jgi:hypothetical protein
VPCEHELVGLAFVVVVWDADDILARLAVDVDGFGAGGQGGGLAAACGVGAFGEHVGWGGGEHGFEMCEFRSCW